METSHTWAGHSAIVLRTHAGTPSDI